MDKKATFLLAGLSGLSAGVVAQQRPNIIYIMCDDMGYGDLGCYGQHYILTPNIDRMASEGIRFTQAYCGSPVSAPSRATFMTGQHSGHTHVRGNKEYWQDKLVPQMYGENEDYTVVGQEPYDTAHVILPEIFKREGYKTGMFGKWAGGYEGSVSTPDKRGVDEFYGYICQFQAHLYFPNFLNEFSRAKGDTAVHRVVLEQNIQHPMYGPEYINRAQYSADLIHRHALEWLDRQTSDEPFFGVFTYTLPHAELRQPLDSILGAYVPQFSEEKNYNGEPWSRYNPTAHGHAEFAAMITRLDLQVGEILQKLREKGLEDNTLVIFTSDNGPHEEGGADPDFFNRDGLLQGKKRSTYEGGIRVPFIVRWPRQIPAGVVSDQMFAFYDLMPTFCDVAGIKNYESKYRNPRLKDDRFDGISMWPAFQGLPQEKQHQYLYWEFHETDMMGIREGDWKLVVEKGQCRLYNLASDIHEDNDVSVAHPDIVRRLVDYIYAEHIDSSDFRITLPQRL
ncbi:MAG: arylsulfatase [Alloprevotella sp.]|nr:arylsulfatase [Alloprevotella sp.]